jgi:regulator of sirC expression with transglutaminase-like and TPR domain
MRASLRFQTMMQSLSPLDYFGLLVADPDSVPLLEASAAIAQDACPDLDLQGVLDTFDGLASRLGDECRRVNVPEARLERALRFFHQTLGFAGNMAAYYDPDNSYLHKVLETRRGIPISLAVLFVELARSVGLAAHGVGFPGHFLVRVDFDRDVAIIDPFTGSVLDRDLIARLADAHGEPAERLLAPATTHQILARMLGNLHQIHERRGDTALREKVEARIRLLGG